MKLTGSLLLIALVQSILGVHQARSSREGNGMIAASSLKAVIVSSETTAHSGLSLATRVSQLSRLPILTELRSMWGE